MFEIDLNVSAEEMHAIVEGMSIDELQAWIAVLRDIHKKVNAFGTISTLALIQKLVETPKTATEGVTIQ